ASRKERGLLSTQKASKHRKTGMGERNSGPLKGPGSGGQFIRPPRSSSDGWRQEAERQRPLPPNETQQRAPISPRGRSAGLLRRPFPSHPVTQPPRLPEQLPPYDNAPALQQRVPSGRLHPPRRTSDLLSSGPLGPGRTRTPSSPGWSSGDGYGR